MSTRLDLGGDGFQMKIHCFRVAPGQDQSDSLASLGTDCAKDVGGSGTLILRCRGARAPAAPAASDLVLLSNPRFVAKPNIYSVEVETEPVRDDAAARTICGNSWLEALGSASAWKR